MGSKNTAAAIGFRTCAAIRTPNKPSPPPKPPLDIPIIKLDVTKREHDWRLNKISGIMLGLYSNVGRHCCLIPKRSIAF